ncbi:hypothetical protein [Natrinema marinum]|uniref:hypothetical protein n=1 Tax=Natrinema marinum TaxID=2961598 RepID=UPI0020C8D702|nr:hypothetical protein [Natrinema marinum]
MEIYDRTPSTGFERIDAFDGGFGWLAHPDEAGLRASHAVRGDAGGVWLFDPLEAPGIDAEIDAFGDVAGVVVCSAYHTRDADRFARRFDAPVYVPTWLGRVSKRLEAPLERFDGDLERSGFAVREVSPLPGWSEAIAYRRSDGTLYVPDLLGTAPPYLAGDERLAVYLLLRPVVPTSAFEGIAPERILLGHGTGVFVDTASHLAEALETARRRFPRALLEGGSQLRALVDAL